MDLEKKLKKISDIHTTIANLNQDLIEWEKVCEKEIKEIKEEIIKNPPTQKLAWGFKFKELLETNPLKRNIQNCTVKMDWSIRNHEYWNITLTYEGDLELATIMIGEDYGCPREAYYNLSWKGINQNIHDYLYMAKAQVEEESKKAETV